ncbi:hypothetical protein [Emticicia sp. W12TSBA100-4]|uniref:hypothetical protein n=1 Tax=Emticicia sp. W12TSBA100-4 TaxID=3160965 RepID=UPI0033065A4D
MRKLTVKLLETPELILEANQLVNDTYYEMYGIEYKGLDINLLQNEGPVIIGTLNEENQLTSTLSVFVNPEKFPSNQFFNFDVPDFIYTNKSIEIGRLSRNFQVKPVFDIKHIEPIALLQGLMHYSKKHRVKYWQATLHPHLAYLLKHEMKLPYNIFFHGIPNIDKKNERFTKFMGSYLDNGIFYVWSDMQLSFEALNKWDLNQFVNFEI